MLPTCFTLHAYLCRQEGSAKSVVITNDANYYFGEETGVSGEFLLSGTFELCPFIFCELIQNKQTNKLRGL
jgi:hypothetical protein